MSHLSFKPRVSYTYSEKGEKKRDQAGKLSHLEKQVLSVSFQSYINSLIKSQWGGTDYF